MTDASEGPRAQIRLPYFYIREDFMKVLKKFAAYYKPYKKIFYLDLLCAAIISAVDLIYPQILRSAANQWFTGSPESIYRILGLLFAALLGLYLLQTVCKYYVTYQGARDRVPIWSAICERICSITTNGCPFPIMIKTTPAR